MTMHQNREFPIQSDGKQLSSVIPWWLAEIAYEGYSLRYGNRQTLEQLAKRGGFGREELIYFLLIKENR